MDKTDFVPAEVMQVFQKLGEATGRGRHTTANYQRAAQKLLKKPQRRKAQKAAKQQRKRNR